MELLEQIEEYLVQTRTSPSTFGRLAVGDPRFVKDLRAGRRPRTGTRLRVLTYISPPQGIGEGTVVNKICQTYLPPAVIP